MVHPFSEWRFSHQRFIFQPRTLVSVEHQQASTSELDPDYVEAAFEHLDAVGMSHGATRYCGAAVDTFQYGA